MRHTRKISFVLTLVSIALTWLFLAGTRTAALLLKVLGRHVGAELLLPARILLPTSTIVLLAAAFIGTLMLILFQALKIRQETRLLLLSGYLCILAICLLVGFVVLTRQVSTLLLPPPGPGVNF
jgi:hypothetical protein